MIAILSGGLQAQDVSPIVSEAVIEAPLDAVWSAWTTNDGLRPFPNAIQQMWTALYFEEMGPRRTHVRVVSLGFRLDEESQKSR